MKLEWAESNEKNHVSSDLGAGFSTFVLQGLAGAAIYADSDVVFTKPIDHLWHKLKEFNPSEIMAIAPTAGHALGGSRFNENFIEHPTGLFQINSGKASVSDSKTD